MSIIFEAATGTARSQITLPKSIRQALRFDAAGHGSGACRGTSPRSATPPCRSSAWLDLKSFCCLLPGAVPLSGQQLDGLQPRSLPIERIERQGARASRRRKHH